MMMEIKPLILIVEDDKSIAKFVKVSMEAQGYKCIETTTSQGALALVFSSNPDVIILDLGLPDMDGLEIIEKIRPPTHAKIIVVSAHGHERIKVEALDTGADDYLTKPFNVSELLARVRVALRQLKQVHALGQMAQMHEEATSFKVGDLLIDFDKRKVVIREEEVHLTPIEFKLIELMAKHAGRVLTHRFMIHEIWGGYGENETQSLRVFMANIRRKIELEPTHPRYIITEVGVGYRLVDE